MSNRNKTTAEILAMPYEELVYWMIETFTPEEKRQVLNLVHELEEYRKTQSK